MKKTRHYHGTDKEGLNSILTNQSIGIRYADGFEGFFVTSDLEQATNHGQHVIVIEDIDPDEMVIHENTGDLMFKGFMPLDRAEGIISDPSDLRVMRDVWNDFIDSIVDDEDKGKSHLSIMDVQKVLAEHPRQNRKIDTLFIPTRLLITSANRE